MNLVDILTKILPFSFAVLSLAAAIFSSVLTNRIKKKRNSNAKIVIKLNDKKVEFDGQNKKEIMEKISQIIDERNLSSLTTEDATNEENSLE